MTNPPRWSRPFPAEWRVLRGKDLFLRRKASPKSGAGIVTAFRDGVVTLRTNRRTDGFTMADKEIGYQSVYKGDLVIHSMDGFAGAIGVSDSDGKCSPVCMVCQNRIPLDTRFYAYIVRHMALCGYIESLAKGIRERSTAFGWSEFSNDYFPYPQPSVQRAIADFLDRKTAAIDALIEKKERLIALLAEKRAALIHQAVTKGLDPDVPMKDSGVPWIGDIPAHWAARPLYARYSVRLGKMLDASAQTGEMSAAYLRNANIQWDAIDTEDLHRMDFSPSDRRKYGLRLGDILMCEGGANSKIVGKSAIWNAPIEECFYQKALHRVRAENVDEQPRFLLYALWAAFSLGVFVVDASANIFHLTAEKLRVMRFAFPDSHEQSLVVSYLDQRLNDARSTERKLASQIDKLKEYRQSLITAAVTGQLEIPS